MIETPLPLDHDDAAASIERYLADGRLLRKDWTRRDGAGRHLACLLAAAVPACGEAQDAGPCPSWLLPPWMAELVLFIDDAGTPEQWRDHVRRFVDLLRRTRVLREERWRCLEYQIRSVALLEARRWARAGMARDEIDRVLSLCLRAGAGDMRPPPEWPCPSGVLYHKETTEGVTAIAAQSVSRYATHAVAARAGFVARCAARDRCISLDAVAKAQQRACDRIIDQILVLWENEIRRAEGMP